MGRGSSKAGGDKSLKVAATEAVDATKLTATQIDRINLQRSDIFQGAVRYSRETAPIEEPRLTKTQQKLWGEVSDGDYSSLEKATPQTLRVVLQQAEHEYDNAQRQLARGHYDIREDYTTNMFGQRRQTGTFTRWYQLRQNSARQVNEIQAALDRKTKPKREITSGTYKRAMKRTTKNVENFMGKK